MPMDTGTASVSWWINLPTLLLRRFASFGRAAPSRFGSPKGDILRIPSAIGFNPARGTENPAHAIPNFRAAGGRPADGGSVAFQIVEAHLVLPQDPQRADQPGGGGDVCRPEHALDLRACRSRHYRLGPQPSVLPVSLRLAGGFGAGCGIRGALVPNPGGPRPARAQLAAERLLDGVSG